MGGIVAHGTLGSNLIWQMFDAAGVVVADVQVRFRWRRYARAP